MVDIVNADDERKRAVEAIGLILASALDRDHLPDVISSLVNDTNRFASVESQAIYLSEMVGLLAGFSGDVIDSLHEHERTRVIHLLQQQHHELSAG